MNSILQAILDRYGITDVKIENVELMLPGRKPKQGGESHGIR